MTRRATFSIGLGITVGVVLGLTAAAGVHSAMADGLRSGATSREAPAGHARVEPRSRIIYPEETTSLRVNHSHPAHRALPCMRCHRDAASSTSAADSLLPTEDRCAPCHNEALDRSRESAERCGFCHVGFGEGGEHFVPQARAQTPRLRFSHATHARRGVRCIDCHMGIQNTDQGTRDHMPTMRSCFRCHGGRLEGEVAPSDDCATCHLTEPDGKLQTHFEEGWMNPPRWLRGLRHGNDWLTRHRWVAADEGETCASCHRESECEDCHDGRTTPRRVHVGDYLTTHPQEARRNERRCATCHSAQNFCLECHARLGLSTISAPSVRSTARVHPPAEVWTRGPNRHAMEARRNLSSCTSCHAESDCTSCHGALGIGGGISPHPRSFFEDCGSLLRATSSACARCHGDISGLAAQCESARARSR